MSDWTAEELDTVGAADELQIAASQADGSLRPYTTIWVVRVGDDLYVRSYRGRAGAWFRSAQRRPEGRIRASGVTRDVTFEEPRDADHDAIDRAYRTKYARYASNYVDPMLNPGARSDAAADAPGLSTTDGTPIAENKEPSGVQEAFEAG